MSSDLDIDGCNPLVVRDLSKRFPFLDETTIICHILSCSDKTDFSNTSKRIRKMLEWREKSFPITPSSISNEINTGKLYINGTDLKGHPLIIFSQRFNDQSTRDVNQMLLLFAYMIESAILKLPEHLAKVSILVDRSGNASADIEFTKQIGKFITDNYPCRIHRVYLYPMSLAVKATWQICKRFFPKHACEVFRPQISLENLKKKVDVRFIPGSLGGECTYVFSPEDFTSQYPPLVVDIAEGLQGRSSSMEGSDSGNRWSGSFLTPAERAVANRKPSYSPSSSSQKTQQLSSPKNSFFGLKNNKVGSFDIDTGVGMGSTDVDLDAELDLSIDQCLGKRSPGAHPFTLPHTDSHSDALMDCHSPTRPRNAVGSGQETGEFRGVSSLDLGVGRGMTGSSLLRSTSGGSVEEEEEEEDRDRTSSLSMVNNCDGYRSSSSSNKQNSGELWESLDRNRSNSGGYSGHNLLSDEEEEGVHRGRGSSGSGGYKQQKQHKPHKSQEWQVASPKPKPR